MKYILLCVLLITPLTIFAITDFSRTLYQGMRGEDVLALQILLNTDPDTQLSENGIGSHGNETYYFGPATKRALIKFQEKYRSEILSPVGLSMGTGIFGLKTREKAKVLQMQVATNSKSKDLSAITDNKDIQNTLAITKMEGVSLMFPSQYSGKPGTNITLTGTGFTAKDNIIYFGTTHAVEKASSWNGQAITFKIPAIPKGVYPLYIKNVRGESNKDQFFVVTDGVTPEPVVESITPQKVTRGEMVTIKGSGFTSKNNMIRAGVTVIEGVVSSDGKTLSFVVPKNVLTATSTASTNKKHTLTVWTYVINENGVSGNKNFLLEI